MSEALAAVSHGNDPTLWAFLSALWSGQQLQIFFTLMAAGSAGMLANWAVKWARGEIRGSLTEYLFRDNVRNSLLALFTYTGASLVAMQADVFHVGDPLTFIGWPNVAWLGATNGYFIDNIVNKGERAVWSKEERIARQEQ